MKTIVKKLVRSRTPIEDIKSFFEGTYRYKLYYSNSILRYLIRKHIREQIDFRIFVMNPECYNQGSCIKCGCMTTALQMAKKSCEGLEYPPLVNRETWKLFKEERITITKDSYAWYIYKKQLIRFTFTEDLKHNFITINENVCLKN